MVWCADVNALSDATGCDPGSIIVRLSLRPFTYVASSPLWPSRPRNQRANPSQHNSREDVRCGGGHLHQQIRGSVKTEEGRWRNRAALSAAYPEKLGLAWGLAVSLACARLFKEMLS